MVMVKAGLLWPSTRLFEAEYQKLAKHPSFTTLFEGWNLAITPLTT
jgi:hypothetical protein